MTSLWLDGAPAVADDALPDRTPDVLVVGAGLTGLTTALLLARAGQDVAVVEARTVGAVTTGNTTGKVSLLQGTHLSRILRHQTAEVGRAYVEANREGMEWLLRFCDEHGVAYQRRRAVTYAADDSERSSVQEEHRAAASLGLEVRWLDRLDVPFPHVGATVLEEQAQIDSMEVLAALVAEVRRHGGTLTQGARVRSVSKSGEPVVTLDDGHELRARHVVVATGASILDRGLHFAKVEPQRSYALAYQWSGALDGMYLSAGSDARSVRDAPAAAATSSAAPAPRAPTSRSCARGPLGGSPAPPRPTAGRRRTTAATTACPSSGACRVTRAACTSRPATRSGAWPTRSPRPAPSPPTSSATCRPGPPCSPGARRGPPAPPSSPASTSVSAWQPRHARRRPRSTGFPAPARPRPGTTAAWWACAPTSADCSPGTTPSRRGTARSTARGSRPAARCSKGPRRDR